MVFGLRPTTPKMEAEVIRYIPMSICICSMYIYTFLPMKELGVLVAIIIRYIADETSGSKRSEFTNSCC